MKIEKIPKDKELIIFDFYDTIMYSVYYHKNYLRKGIRELTDSLLDQNKTMVISSDGDADGIYWDFGYATNAEFQERFKKTYGSSNLIFDKEKGIFYKNLEFICEEQNISPNKSIFIGDDFKGEYNPFGMDSTSSERFGIDYIIVPSHFKNSHFSFMSLLYD